MNHKRRRPKHQRAGCLLCKPHKDEREAKRERRSARRGDWRYLAALPFAVLALALHVIGCVSAQRMAVDALARAVNAESAGFVEREHAEADAAIDHAPPTPSAMHAAQAAAHARWAPVWDAIGALAAAETAWLAGSSPLDVLLAASCRLTALVHDVAPGVALPPIGVCP